MTNQPDRLDRIEATLENMAIRLDLSNAASSQRMDRMEMSLAKTEALLNKAIEVTISNRHAANERMDRIESNLDVIATSLSSQNQRIQSLLSAVERLEVVTGGLISREGNR